MVPRAMRVNSFARILRQHFAKSELRHLIARRGLIAKQASQFRTCASLHLNMCLSVPGG